VFLCGAFVLLIVLLRLAIGKVRAAEAVYIVL
jgi:hypothetical protein